MGGSLAILDVSAKELNGRQAVLTVSVSEERLDPFLRTASRRLASRLSIPGFRKGKAPHGVVLRQVGKEALIREAIDELGKVAYEEAVEKSGLEPLQLDDLDVAEWDPLTLSLTVSLEPIVELGEYKSTPLDTEHVGVEGVDIEDVLRNVQEQYAERVPVQRPAALGDFALLDVQGNLEGRVVLDAHQQEYELDPDAEFPAADIGERLLGMSVGEHASFSLAFPDDYADEDLAGREVAVDVHLHDLHEKRIPEVNDDLARMAGFPALEELRRKIGEDLRLRGEAERKDGLAEGVLDALAESAQIDFPPLFVNRELETMVRALALDLQNQSFTLEGYLNATERTIEQLLDEFRPTAEKRVKKALVLAKLVEEEGIEVEDVEIEEEIARITQVYGQDTSELRDALLRNEQVREDIRDKLYGRKIVERLLEVRAGAAREEMTRVKEASATSEDDRDALQENSTDSS